MRINLSEKTQVPSDKQKILRALSCIGALSQLKLPASENIFLCMLKEKGRFTKGYSIDLLYAIGRVGRTPASLNAVIQECYNANTGERIAAFWALGYLGSREKESPFPMSF